LLRVFLRFQRGEPPPHLGWLVMGAQPARHLAIPARDLGWIAPSGIGRDIGHTAPYSAAPRPCQHLGMGNRVGIPDIASKKNAAPPHFSIASGERQCDISPVSAVDARQTEQERLEMPYSIPERIDPNHYGAALDAGALWSFETARYTVAFFALDEDILPSDSFEFQRDIDFASTGDPAHWFCAAVGVYDEHGDLIGHDYLGGCSYNSFREFYSAHRWQYSRRQGKWITDPKSRAWKACEARRPRRPDGSRADGHCFPSMVRAAIRKAKAHELMKQFVAA
jgi:hypothetical protein